MARIGETLHVEVPLPALLAAPTAAHMAMMIAEHLMHQTTPIVTDHLLVEVEGLSENEVQARLAHKEG